MTGQAFGQADASFRSDSVRLQQLVQQVQHNEKAASTWWVTWIGIYASATVGQGMVAYLTPDKSTREDMVLGAGTTLLGIVGQFITPVKSGYNAGQFDQHSGLDRAEQLSQAEALLAFQANIARSGKSWQTQALFGTVNIASGLVTWLGFKRSVWDGVTNFALNTAITEIQIYSQPVRAVKDYADCVSTHQRAISVQAFALPGGMGLVMNF